VKETYVKIVGKERTKDWPDTYCPIDLEKKSVLLGLTLIGFVPDGAEVVGEYNEDTNELCFSQKQSGETK
jgi:hypothetical protein